MKECYLLCPEIIRLHWVSFRNHYPSNNTSFPKFSYQSDTTILGLSFYIGQSQYGLYLIEGAGQGLIILETGQLVCHVNHSHYLSKAFTSISLLIFFFNGGPPNVHSWGRAWQLQTELQPHCYLPRSLQQQ